MTVISANDDVAAKLPAATPLTVKGSVRFAIDARHHVGLPMLHHLHAPQLATVATTT